MMPYQTISPFATILLFLVIGVAFLNAMLLVTGVIQNNSLTKRERKAVRVLNLTLLGWTILTYLTKQGQMADWLIDSTPYFLVIALAAGIVVATYKGVKR